MPDTLIHRVETESERLLDEYVRAVRERVSARGSVEDTVNGIVQAHAALMVEGFRMPDAYRTVRDDKPYTRNLVYQCPEARFSVISICWAPFQETSVHDHLNWCVVGVLEGIVHAIDYVRLDDESAPGRAQLEIGESSLHRVGSIIGLTPPPRSNIHKMGNGGYARAISLHTYGDPGTRARVFDPAAGTFDIVDLEFHNP